VRERHLVMNEPGVLLWLMNACIPQSAWWFLLFSLMEKSRSSYCLDGAVEVVLDV